MLFRESCILYITFMIAVQCSLKFFAERYLGDIVQLSPLASCLVLVGNDRPSRVACTAGMTTVVRFEGIRLHLP